MEACHVDYLNNPARSGVTIALDDLPPKMRKFADEMIADPEGHGGIHTSNVAYARKKLGSVGLGASGSLSPPKRRSMQRTKQPKKNPKATIAKFLKGL